MKFQLPKLDYQPSAFGSFLSVESFTYHYGKHHQAYIDQTNKVIQSTPFESASLETIVKESKDKLYNQSAQAWNHTFYWKSMTPQKETPSRELETAITSRFGTMDLFAKEFVEKGVSQFGSGWVWLVQKEMGDLSSPLEIVSTSNAENPIRMGMKPILACDVWEHAYYIDHRNAREAFLKEWVTKAAWQFASANFSLATLPEMGATMVHDSGWEPLRTESEGASKTLNLKSQNSI
ncbi:MAG: superoxide dismutase [Fe] [Cryobacterium sp.]|nr:superoxide dismutase [Fe] [Oligoflexia bacterium]